MATEKQHNAIKRIMDDLDASEPHLPDDLRQTVITTIDLLNKDDLLPDLVGPDYESVAMNMASWAMSTLINLSNMTKPYRPSPYPGIKGADFVFHAKLGGKHCVGCGAYIRTGVDWTAKINGAYVNYCTTCASVDVTAQDECRRVVAMQHPGLHITEGSVWRVDDDGVHKRLHGANFGLVTTHYPVLDHTTLLTAERARAYAAEHKQCVACGEDIGHKTTRRSLAAGYGPVCAKRYGWPYPTEQQAEAILSATNI